MAEQFTTGRGKIAGLIAGIALCALAAPALAAPDDARGWGGRTPAQQREPTERVERGGGRTWRPAAEAPSAPSPSVQRPQRSWSPPAEPQNAPRNWTAPAAPQAPRNWNAPTPPQAPRGSAGAPRMRDQSAQDRNQSAQDRDQRRSEGNWTDRNRTYADRDRDRTYVDRDRRDRSDRREDWRNRSNWRDNRHHDSRRYDRDDHRRWDNRWRHDRRYDWHSYRSSHRSLYRLRPYYAPYRNYYYSRIGIGFFLDSLFFGADYVIGDPWMYRLPSAYGPYRWVRYYDDALLVNIYTGEVVDVIYDFFW